MIDPQINRFINKIKIFIIINTNIKHIKNSVKTFKIKIIKNLKTKMI